MVVDTPFPAPQWPHSDSNYVRIRSSICKNPRQPKFRKAKKTKTEYSFKQALKDASKRKGEMGSVSNVMPKSMKKSKTMKKSKSMKKGKKMGKKSKTSKRRH